MRGEGAPRQVGELLGAGAMEIVTRGPATASVKHDLETGTYCFPNDRVNDCRRVLENSKLDPGRFRTIDWSLVRGR
jgi:hypothetical protein